MATIVKRGNSYRIMVSCGRDTNDKQIFKTTTYKPTATTPKRIEKEVNDFAREFEKKVHNGDVFDGDSIKFSEFIKIWENRWGKQNLTTRILEDYLYVLDKRVVPHIGNMYLSKIKRIHIQSIIDGMVERGSAPKTVKWTFTCINSVIKYAYRMEIIEKNPCDRISLPRIKQVTEIQYFTLDQAKTFLRALEGTYPIRMKAHTRTLKATGQTYSVPEYTETRVRISTQIQVYFNLAVYGGFRRGELIALTWEDINFKEQTVNICKAVSKTKAGQIVKEPKTESGKRVVSLPKVCFEKLAKWRREQMQLAVSLGSKWEGYRGKDYDKNNIFITDTGSQMCVDTPSHKFKEILAMYNATVPEENQLPIIRLHDLRHTCATLLLSENVDIETVSHRLGHSKASVTLDIYGHALETKDRSASDKLTELFA